MNTALDFWEGDGGSAYAVRNSPTTADVDKRVRALSRIFNKISAPKTILEVGCGPGANLVALRRLLGDGVQLHACDPNESARKIAQDLCAAAFIYDGHASAINAADEVFDLVMTAGVLIHIQPDRLSLAMDEIIRVSNKYVLCIEYFAPECEPIKYYGDFRIWRNNYGKLYVNKGLKMIGYGFFWAEDSGYDNVVWNLLEK